MKPERPVAWYVRPDGSIHAFRGIRSACRQWTWQADHTPVVVDLLGITNDPRCRECVAATETGTAASASAR